MHRTLRFAAAWVLAAAIAPWAAHAEDPGKPTPAEAEPVCGRALMTPEEMAEHRDRMWGARTPAERDAYRAEHHAAMAKRAQERGVALNPAGCPGGGMGSGAGRGMGGPRRGMGGGPPPSAPPAPAPGTDAPKP